MKTAQKLLTILGGGATPAQLYDLRVAATNLIRYNKLNETSGTAIVDSSGNAFTGTYTGVDLANTGSPFLPDKAPFFDGVNDYGALFSAAFASAFKMNEGCILLWVKVNSAAVWSDGAVRMLFEFDAGGNDRVYIRKEATNDTISFVRTGNAASKSVSHNLSPTAYFSAMLSWSIANDQLKAYVNGVQVGSTQTALTISAATITAAVLASLNTTPSQVWHGWLSRLTIWDRPADAAIIALGVP